MKNLHAQKSPIPKSELKLLYDQICDGSRNNAKRILSNISDGRDHSEWDERYLKALEGMVLSLGDENSYLSRLTNNGYTKKHLQEIDREFESRIQSPLLELFDQGFFSAWMLLVQTFREHT